MARFGPFCGVDWYPFSGGYWYTLSYHLHGDFNATATDIDTYPKPDKMPDDLFFLPETRDGLLRLLETGFVDVFRETYPTKEGAYTWWGPKHKERLENRGTHLDYFLASGELFFYVQEVTHHEDIL